jgi:hypothetical protein
MAKRTVGVYTYADLPAATKGKASKNWGLGDLNPANQAEAATRDFRAIVDGTKVIVMAPTGSLTSALEAVKTERESKGI